MGTTGAACDKNATINIAAFSFKLFKIAILIIVTPMSDYKERAVVPAIAGWVEIYLELGYLVPSGTKFIIQWFSTHI
jgi:hypothetical protein